MLTKNQLVEREGKIFSTDAAAALGVSKYRTPYQLWLEKTGQMDQQENVEVPDYMLLGELFEPQIAKLYTMKTGRVVIPHKETEFHDSIPWMGSHFDFRGADRLVEIKNFGLMRRKEFGEPGSSDVPPDVKVQVIHEMAVSNVPLCDVAVVFGGNTFAVFTVALTGDDEDELIEREREFMRFVESREAPPPTSIEDLKLRFPSDMVANVVANEKIMASIKMHHLIGERIDALDEALVQETVAIKTYMGSAGLLLDTDGTVLASWKKNRDSQFFDQEAFAKRHPKVFKKYLKTRTGARPFSIKEEK